MTVGLWAKNQNLSGPLDYQPAVLTAQSMTLWFATTLVTDTFV
jgi:hypothetical protein